MSDSIFTKIIKGDIPCHKIYEDDKTIAFLDIHPSQPGHTLVIPKLQIDHLWDLPDEDYQALMKTLKKVALHLRETLSVKRVGVHVVGLDVPHAHIHLVPFNTMEEYRHVPDMSAEPDHKALAELAQKLAIKDN
jgi:histidine triad (HIT) family protein